MVAARVESLEIPAEMTCLGQALEFVRECARAYGFSKDLVVKIEVVLEEVFVNICLYAYGREPGKIQINCQSETSRYGMRIEIVDYGKPFDPLEDALPPDRTLDISKRHIGGLGILMVRQMADGVDYCRKENSNHLFLDFHKTGN
jgi:anti-sigma regulatory factor (Ser/Thr protein kinase)